MGILQLILAGMDKIAHMKGYQDIRVSYLVGGRAIPPAEGRKGDLITPDTLIMPGVYALHLLQSYKYV